MSSSLIYECSQLNRVIREKLGQSMSFKICGKKSGSNKSEELLHFSGGIPGQVQWSEDPMNLVRDAAERLDLIQLSTEFYPSSASQLLTDEVKVDDHKSSVWFVWFKKITNAACLTPDTNVLLKRTLTSVILPKFATQDERFPNHWPFTIAIPRLSILELEGIANGANSANSRRTSKGECFMAFNEVRTLKESGAILTGPLSSDEISAFHRAKYTFADALLREEVRKFGSSKNARAIFLTRDMVSALAANSEDLDAIYMAPKNPEQLSLKDLGIAQVSELLIELATACSEITLNWNDGTVIRIQGVWSGKNWFDYYKRRVRVISIS